MAQLIPLALGRRWVAAPRRRAEHGIDLMLMNGSAWAPRQMALDSAFEAHLAAATAWVAAPTPPKW